MVIIQPWLFTQLVSKVIDYLTLCAELLPPLLILVLLFIQLSSQTCYYLRLLSYYLFFLELFFLHQLRKLTIFLRFVLDDGLEVLELLICMKKLLLKVCLCRWGLLVLGGVDLVAKLCLRRWAWSLRRKGLVVGIGLVSTNSLFGTSDWDLMLIAEKVVYHWLWASVEAPSWISSNHAALILFLTSLLSWFLTASLLIIAAVWSRVFSTMFIAEVIILELFWRQESLLYIGNVKVGRDMLEFAWKLAQSFSLAQNGQVTSIWWWTCHKRFVKLAKGYYLVQQKHGIQVSIPLPYKAWTHLA